MNIATYWDDILLEYVAYNEDDYCGCVDCQDPLGYGTNKQEAIDDLCEKLDYNGSK